MTCCRHAEVFNCICHCIMILLFVTFNRTSMFNCFTYRSTIWFQDICYSTRDYITVGLCVPHILERQRGWAHFSNKVKQSRHQMESKWNITCHQTESWTFRLFLVAEATHHPKYLNVIEKKNYFPENAKNCTWQ